MNIASRSLRVHSVFCVSGLWLALQNSHFRCGFIANSVFQAIRWHSEFAFPLRFHSEFCFSSDSLALGIRISTAVSLRILVLRRFAGTQNSHFRCGFIANSACQAIRWHTEFAFPLRFQNEFRFSSDSLALGIRISAAVS